MAGNALVIEMTAETLQSLAARRSQIILDTRGYARADHVVLRCGPEDVMRVEPMASVEQSKRPHA
jgi:hypothetical protein